MLATFDEATVSQRSNHPPPGRKFNAKRAKESGDPSFTELTNLEGLEVPPGEDSDDQLTEMVIVPEPASRRSLGDNSTGLVNLPETMQGLSGDISETALIPSTLMPVPSSGEITTTRVDNQATLPLGAPVPAELLKAKPGGLKGGRDLHATVVRAAPLLDAKPKPERSGIVGEATAMIERPRPGSESTAVIERPELSGKLEDPSLGAKSTRPGGIPAEATEVRQVFARFATPEPARKRRSDEALRHASMVTPHSSSPRLWLVGVLALVVLIGGWGVTSWYRQRRHVIEQRLATRSAVEQTHLHGRLRDFVWAESQLRAVVSEQLTEGAVRSARALVLCEAQYELGGGPPVTNDGFGEGAAGGLHPWTEEAQSAARFAEGENNATALAAQIYQALSQADLKRAEGALTQLTALPQSADDSSELSPLPVALREYLSSQVALLAGREAEALTTLSIAVGKNPLPLWRRRYGYLLLRAGRDGEALTQLTAVEKQQPDLCGVQIDLAFLRGRSSGAAEHQALATLRGYSEPPRASVGDPCGRGERARAALLSAELTLFFQPTARSEARTLLEKAKSLVPADDITLADALSVAWLRTADSQLAEQQSQAALERVPTRRRTRLLLVQALLARGQGSEALSVLDALPGAGATAAKPPASENLDSEVLLWRAQALLALNDTLEAQKLVRRVLASTATSAFVRSDAQLLLARVYLKLWEPASARRALEPLIRQANAAPTGASGHPTPDGANQEQLLEAQLLLAQALLASRPPEPTAQSEARALLEAVVGRAPEHVEARLMLGRLLRDLGEWALAEQQLSSALRTDERYTAARRDLAALLLQRGDYRKAHTLYSELTELEQGADLLLAAARAERLDGVPDQAWQTLATVKRSRGEVTGKYDEALFVEKGRTLLALDRCSETATLLRPIVGDLPALRHPTLPALYIRAVICGIAADERSSESAAQLQLARALLTRLPAVWRQDLDVELAEAELLNAEHNGAAARPVLQTLLTNLQTVRPSSVGEEAALRQQAQTLLDGLPAAVPPPPARNQRRR